MASFGLLDSVRSALNTPTTNVSPSTFPKAPPTPVPKYTPVDANTSNATVPSKDIRNILTLDYGDKIIDNEGNVRYIISVDTRTRNVLMTGRKRNLSNYGKAFIWSEEKFRLALSKKGFRLA